MVVHESRDHSVRVDGEVLWGTRDCYVDEACFEVQVEFTEDDLDAVGERTVVGCVERDFVVHVEFDGMRGLVGRQEIH